MGEIENCFLSWEDSGIDIDPQQVVTKVHIKTSWIKQGWWNSGKTCAKKGKTLPQEALDLVQSFYEDHEYSRQIAEKKGYVSTGQNVHKQKGLVLCNLSEPYSAFRDKYLNIKIRFSKFCTLRPKWCVLTGSSVLVVDVIDWKYT